MELNPSDVKVVFRMPGALHFECLISGDGPDCFKIATFDRQTSVTDLIGQFQRIENERDLSAIVASWTVPEGEEIPLQTGEQQYKDMVLEARRHIEQGDFEKVVLAGVFIKQTRTDIAGLLNRLHIQNPNAFVYAFCVSGRLMIGASPETLLSCKGSVMHTEALGGTPADGSYGLKEIREHEQIANYISDVLVEYGFAFRKGIRTIKHAGLLEHLQTGFEIDAMNSPANMALAMALHPTSAVCGLPFNTSYMYIQSAEPFKRGYYAGYLGPVRSNGDFSLFVNLRCAEVYSHHVLMYAGAGINSMSDPAAEWKEINRKKETIASLLN